MDSPEVPPGSEPCGRGSGASPMTDCDDPCPGAGPEWPASLDTEGAPSAEQKNDEPPHAVPSDSVPAWHKGRVRVIEAEFLMQHFDELLGRGQQMLLTPVDDSQRPLELDITKGQGPDRAGL